MFPIGDYVVSQRTGHIGKVIGYGHQILNGIYMPTLKVLVPEGLNSKKSGLVEEDLHSTWTQWPEVSHNTLK